MKGLLGELKRRNVFRVAAVYAVVGWIIVQVTDAAVPALHMPEWVYSFVFFILLIGFPVALVFAWAFELTPDGIKLEKHVDRSASTARQTGRNLDLLVIGVLALAVVYFATDKFLINKESAQPVVEARQPSSPLAGAETSRQSVAVLPFANRGADQESGFFAEGIHDDLLTQLAKIAGLKVISRTSVMEYKDTTKNMKQIGDELGVAHILEGGIQKSGTRVRINAQLIDADTDEHLWAETFDRELTTDNIFDIQSEIALAITNAMQMQLAPETAQQIATAPTQNVAAYQDFLAGKKYFDEALGAGGVLGEARDTAQAFFESAVDKDAGFALAWIYLAWAKENAFWFGRGDSARQHLLAESEADLERARELDPDNPLLHLVRGLQYYHGYLDYPNALRELDLAEQGMPSNSEVHVVRAWVLRRMGQFEQSRNSIERAYVLDPRSQSVLNTVQGLYTLLRHFDAARRVLDKAIANDPTRINVRVSRANVEIEQYGNGEAGFAVATRPDATNSLIPFYGAYVALLSNDPARGQVFLDGLDGESAVFFPGFVLHPGEYRGQIYQHLGQDALGRQALEEALALYRQHLSENPESGEAHDAVARALAYLGRGDEAIPYLATARGLHESNLQNDRLAQVTQSWRNAGHYCIAGDMQTAAQLFRDILSGPYPPTLGRLVNSTPGCREAFMATEYYAPLEEEFGHLTQSVPRNVL